MFYYSFNYSFDKQDNFSYTSWHGCNESKDVDYYSNEICSKSAMVSMKEYLDLSCFQVRNEDFSQENNHRSGHVFHAAKKEK